MNEPGELYVKTGRKMPSVLAYMGKTKGVDFIEGDW